MQKFDPILYKFRSRTNWNTVAKRYHRNWVNNDIGPFGSTNELIKIADIHNNDSVLDIACGTGALSKRISKIIGNNGKLIGIDLSRSTLNIAKQEIQSANICFIEMDAEKIWFATKFSRIVCQYGLMFLTDPIRILRSIIELIEENGKITLAVHGKSENVPYFSCIMNSIIKNIPNIIPKGSPSVHTLGDRNKLLTMLKKSGFRNIIINEYVFSFSPGTFEQYWQDYMDCTANSIRDVLEKDTDILLTIKRESKKNVTQFIKNGKIFFPWEVLIASAQK